ncbi:MAG: hypothetical protein MK179_13220 [Pirellulaceae bacterium]|nr:hypothetical protein [Pirellulaceae bacterium]
MCRIVRQIKNQHLAAAIEYETDRIEQLIVSYKMAGFAQIKTQKRLELATLALNPQEQRSRVTFVAEDDD